jgi:phosphate transport system substrate-binding protein
MKKTGFKESAATVLAAATLVSLCAAPLAYAAAAKTVKTVKADGIKVAADVAPAIKGETAMISLKTVERALGATTTYKSKKATIKTTLNTVVFRLGKSAYTINGKSAKVSKAPVLTKKKIMVPADTLLKALGGKATLSGKTLNLTYAGTLKGALKITGSSTLTPVAQAAAKKINSLKKGAKISIAQSDSGMGISDTMKGVNNLGMSSRELKDAEKPGLKTYTVAKDAVALIVNPKNKVKALTVAQARKILLGEIKNWKEVGGKNAAIRVYTRESNSGTLSTVKDLLLDKKNVVKTATQKGSSALIKQAVAKDANGIGFDSIGFVNKTVKAVKLGGVTPSTATVRNGKYLLGRSLYLVSKGKPVSNGAKYIDFLKSAFGQKSCVAKLGYIALR